MIEHTVDGCLGVTDSFCRELGQPAPVCLPARPCAVCSPPPSRASCLLFLSPPNQNKQDYNASETLTSLGFAQRCKKVSNKASAATESKQMRRLKMQLAKMRDGGGAGGDGLASPGPPEGRPSGPPPESPQSTKKRGKGGRPRGGKGPGGRRPLLARAPTSSAVAK